MPARITFADTHSAKERKKKKEIIIKISTTEPSQPRGFHSAVYKGVKRTSGLVIWEEATRHNAARYWSLSEIDKPDRILSGLLRPALFPHVHWPTFEFSVIRGEDELTGSDWKAKAT